MLSFDARGFSLENSTPVTTGYFKLVAPKRESRKLDYIDSLKYGYFHKAKHTYEAHWKPCGKPQLGSTVLSAKGGNLPYSLVKHIKLPFFYISPENLPTTEQETVFLSKEQLAKLNILLIQLEKPAQIPAPSIAKALYAAKDQLSSIWVIYLGSNNHMTGYTKFFLPLIQQC